MADFLDFPVAMWAAEALPEIDRLTHLIDTHEDHANWLRAQIDDADPADEDRVHALRVGVNLTYDLKVAAGRARSALRRGITLQDGAVRAADPSGLLLGEQGDLLDDCVGLAGSVHPFLRDRLTVRQEGGHEALVKARGLHWLVRCDHEALLVHPRHPLLACKGAFNALHWWTTPERLAAFECSRTGWDEWDGNVRRAAAREYAELTAGKWMELPDRLAMCNAACALWTAQVGARCFATAPQGDATGMASLQELADRLAMTLPTDAQPFPAMTVILAPPSPQQGMGVIRYQFRLTRDEEAGVITVEPDPTPVVCQTCAGVLDGDLDATEVLDEATDMDCEPDSREALVRAHAQQLLWFGQGRRVLDPVTVPYVANCPCCGLDELYGGGYRVTTGEGAAA